MKSVCSVSAKAATALSAAILLGSFALAQDVKQYQVRSFSAGPAWFVFDEDVDVGVHVLNPDDPKCHELGEIVLLFESRDQLKNEAQIRASALKGVENYAALCRSLGNEPSKQRNVVGLIAGEATPDTQGRVIGEARVLEGVVSSLTGQYELRIRHNAAADGGSDNGKRVAQATSAASGSIKIGPHREKFDAMLADSTALAPSPGAVSRLTNARNENLAGVWSGGTNDCVKERVIFLERDGRGSVEWWRAPNVQIGLVPWRTGSWELRDQTLIASFDYRVEYDRLRKKLRAGPIDETVQFELKEARETELRLAAIGGGFSPGRLFLGGAEKVFVGCSG